MALRGTTGTSEGPTGPPGRRNDSATGLAVRERGWRSDGVAEVFGDEKSWAQPQPRGSLAGRVIVEITAEPFVPARLVRAEVAGEFAVPPRYVKGQELGPSARDDLPDRSSSEIALVDYESDCGVSAHPVRQSGPRAREDPERVVFPEEPRRAHGRAVRRNPGRQRLRQELIDVKVVASHLVITFLRLARHGASAAGGHSMRLQPRLRSSGGSVKLSHDAAECGQPLLLPACRGGERHESGLHRPAAGRMPGMPRRVMARLAVMARMAWSFWAAAARVVSIAATSPSQPWSLASWSRSPRLA